MCDFRQADPGVLPENKACVLSLEQPEGSSKDGQGESILGLVEGKGKGSEAGSKLGEPEEGQGSPAPGDPRLTALSGMRIVGAAGLG